MTRTPFAPGSEWIIDALGDSPHLLFERAIQSSRAPDGVRVETRTSDYSSILDATLYFEWLTFMEARNMDSKAQARSMLECSRVIISIMKSDGKWNEWIEVSVDMDSVVCREEFEKWGEKDGNELFRSDGFSATPRKLRFRVLA